MDLSDDGESEYHQLDGGSEGGGQTHEAAAAVDPVCVVCENDALPACAAARSSPAAGMSDMEPDHLDLVRLVREAAALLLVAVSRGGGYVFTTVRAETLPASGSRRALLLGLVERQALRAAEARGWLARKGTPVVFSLRVNLPLTTLTRRVVDEETVVDIPGLTRLHLKLWQQSANACTQIANLLVFLLESLMAKGVPLRMASRSYGTLTLAQANVVRGAASLALNPFSVVEPGTYGASERNIPIAQQYYAPDSKHDIVRLRLKGPDGRTHEYWVDPTARQIDPYMPTDQGPVRFMRELPSYYLDASGLTEFTSAGYDESPASQKLFVDYHLRRELDCPNSSGDPDETLRCINEVLNRYLDGIRFAL